jgi:hypothetical protein
VIWEFGFRIIRANIRLTKQRSIFKNDSAENLKRKSVSINIYTADYCNGSISGFHS